MKSIKRKEILSNNTDIVRPSVIKTIALISMILRKVKAHLSSALVFHSCEAWIMRACALLYPVIFHCLVEDL